MPPKPPQRPSWLPPMPWESVDSVPAKMTAEPVLDPQEQAEITVDRRRTELLALGYPPGVVELSIDWARNSSKGMVKYVAQPETPQAVRDLIYAQFLQRYLMDTEKWIKVMTT